MPMKPSRAVLLAGLAALAALAGPQATEARAKPAARAAAAKRAPVVLNDDGGWCWFQDERALVTGGQLVFSSVAAGRRDPARRGQVEVTSVELASGAISRFRLSATPVEPSGRYDDHDVAALVEREDGRLLAVWAGHGFDNRILHRISKSPRDAREWGDERAFVPSPSSRVTYANLFRLASENGRIYDFFRGLDNRFKPSWAWSDDGGASFRTGGVAIDVPAAFRHRPYVKYASDGRDTIHLVYTEGHPRDFDNSLYHVYYRKDALHRSDGSAIRPLAEGLRDPVEGTRIFQGDPANVAWVADVELDLEHRPLAAYSVQKGSAGLPPGQGGEDHRYRLARWTGGEWVDHEIARAGRRLYPNEDDYTGGVALVPGDPERLFISTDVDPVTGAPLVSRADGKRHYEIFRGQAREGGRGFHFEPVTRDSTVDNLRPIVPRTGDRRELLLWLRGSYRSYTDYALEVVAIGVGER
jgi:hypothetical protein